MTNRDQIEIRPSVAEDLPAMMEAYRYARSFMASHGNPNQWGPTNWPPEALLLEDIASGHSYVCEVVRENAQAGETAGAAKESREFVGTFFFHSGFDIEPTYRVIEDGEWIGDLNYGVIHRIASNGKVRGVAHAAIEWAYAKCGHLRIDTHTDNKVMQSLLEKEGFVHCGTIYVTEDPYPRMAYEKIGSRPV